MQFLDIWLSFVVINIQKFDCSIKRCKEIKLAKWKEVCYLKKE